MIKEITITDTEYIKQIIELRYLMQYEEKNINTVDLASNKNIITENIHRFIMNHLAKDFFAFAYVEDEKIISLCCLQVVETFPSGKNYTGLKGTVCSVYTRKEFRKLGYQNKTMTALIEKAIDLKIKILKVNTNNPVAEKLYSKYGFQKEENGYKAYL